MADGLNNVQIIGNLGADPEMRYTTNGKAVTTMRLAVSRSFGNGEGGQRQEETEWFSVVAWEKLAELVAQHLQRGRKVYVQGRLATRSWEKDGAKHYKTEVVANQVLFLDRATGPVGGFNPDDTSDLDPDDLPFED